MSINSGPNPYPTSYSDPYSRSNYQPEPWKGRPVNRRVFLGRVGVGVLGAGLLVSAGYRAGVLGSYDEQLEARRPEIYRHGAEAAIRLSGGARKN